MCARGEQCQKGRRVSLFNNSGHWMNQSEARRMRAGRIFLVVAFVGAAALAWAPSPYVIQEPGSTFDTLGSVLVDDEEVPLIDIPSQEVFETQGSLSLLTVNIRGSRQTPPSWIDVAAAWFDPSKAVVPVDTVYPEGRTVEQSNEANQALMQESQSAASAAALTQLGYDVKTALLVGDVVPDSPADGVLQTGDLLLSANGEKPADAAGLRDIIKANGLDSAVELSVSREGQMRQLAVTPEASPGEGNDPYIGVTLAPTYELPFDVDIRLEDVGGPSAGMMFALGVIDKLTPGALTGGQEIAGTGTLTASGSVGPIGGIRQKLYGAANSGADWFLTPKDNCDEVLGHVPDGLDVFAVGSLEEAVDAVEAIAAGDTSELPGCSVS
ncbi:MAG: ATP-dependent serine peptidase containing a domain protein [Homoserinimonas sp.]|jgi:PDZ domain-containing protein|nr:ATP-dependent serine peptidase containing a domain protein [Homoserinimonas sp.]